MYKPLERGYFTKREMEALGEPVGMPDRGPAFGEKTDIFSAIGDIGGSLIEADATKSAANDQLQGVREANALQKEMWQTTRQDNMPALESRNWALEQLKAKLSGGFTPTNVQNEAGYQFGMNQGMQALQNQLAARGMRNSGAALKAGTKFAQDYAGTKYDTAFNRNLQALNPFMSLAGLGQVGAGTIANAGQNYANQMGNNAMQAGNVNALSGLAQANQWGNALKSAGGWFDDYMKNSGGSSSGNPFGTAAADMGEWWN